MEKYHCLLVKRVMCIQVTKKNFAEVRAAVKTMAPHWGVDEGAEGVWLYNGTSDLARWGSMIVFDGGRPQVLDIKKFNLHYTPGWREEAAPTPQQV